MKIREFHPLYLSRIFLKPTYSQGLPIIDLARLPLQYFTSEGNIGEDS
jgi:hypothetical protein